MDQRAGQGITPSRFSIAVFWLGYVVCVGLFTFFFFTGKSRFTLDGWDDQHYYVYARSLAVDGDLDFANEYERLYGNSSAGDSPELVVPLTATGMRRNRYAAGMPLLLVPTLVLAHGVTWLVNRVFHAGLAYDGWSPVYVYLYCLGSITIAWIGISLVVTRILRSHVDMLPAAWALFALFWGTNLFYYVIFQPGMVHAVSIGLAGAYFYILWDERLRRNPVGVTVAGLLNGLLAAVRYTDLLIGLAYAVQAVFDSIGDVSRRGRRPAVLFFVRAAIYGVGVLIGFLPQFLVWRVIEGKWVANTYGGYGFAWTQPAVIQSLFSTRNSLFLYSPIVLLGLAGLFFGVRRGHAAVVVGGAAFMLTLLYVNASWCSWWFGASFGARAMLACWPVWLLGMAWLTQRVLLATHHRYRMYAVLYVFVTFLCVAWTCLLGLLFHLGRISHENGFTWHELAHALRLR